MFARVTHREGVEEDSKEEQQNDNDDDSNDDPLEPPPQDVFHRFKWRGEPQEGCLRAPARGRHTTS